MTSAVQRKLRRLLIIFSDAKITHKGQPSRLLLRLFRNGVYCIKSASHDTPVRRICVFCDSQRFCARIRGIACFAGRSSENISAAIAAITRKYDSRRHSRCATCMKYLPVGQSD
ncbi:hypothetical protein KCP70_08390 [Salmonella enterica subsp. enterica]|nr:hypothetical protein KCP70_08390 [Salmonella enterica subsp. enterica]